MFTSGQSIPGACKRCGKTLPEHVLFCTQCGVLHPLEAESPSAVAASDATLCIATAMATSAAQETTAQQAIRDADGADGASLPLPSQLAVPPDHSPTPAMQASRWRFGGGLALIVTLGLAYGGFLLLPGIHSNSSGSNEDARSSAGAIGGYASKHSMPESTIPAPPEQTAAPLAAKAVVKPPHYRDIADSLQIVQLHLDTNDLSGARAILDAAAAMQPGNAEVSAFQRELVSRELRRDHAIQAARTCAKDRVWGCVKSNALAALAIDKGDGDAQALLARAIVETGWTPLARNQPQAALAVPAGKANAADADAQARAIVESGWKHPAGNSATAPDRVPAH